MVNDLIKLYNDKKELKLLEVAYFFITIISFMIAGIVALFSQPLGVSILIIPLISLVAGVMNIVAWSLVKLAMEHLIAKQEAKKPTGTKKKTATKKK